MPKPASKPVSSKLTRSTAAFTSRSSRPVGRSSVVCSTPISVLLLILQLPLKSGYRVNPADREVSECPVWFTEPTGDFLRHLRCFDLFEEVGQIGPLRSVIRHLSHPS